VGRGWGIFATVALVAGSVAGCRTDGRNAGPDGASGSEGGGRCGVLDAAAVGRVLGERVVDQSLSFRASAFEDLAFGSEGCSFATDDGIEVAVLRVADEQGRSAAVVEQVRTTAAVTAGDVAAGPDPAVLADLGDDAFYDPFSGAIVVLVDDHTLTVFVGDPFGQGRGADVGALVSVARDVVAVAQVSNDVGRGRRFCDAVEPIAAEWVGSIRGRGTGDIPGSRDGVGYTVFECSFAGEDGVHVDIGRAERETFDVLDQRDDPLDERPFQPVSGVGDLAFWWRTGLWVVEEDTGLLIDGDDGTLPATDAQVVSVARLAVRAFGG
jgi:hypothetical protein